MTITLKATITLAAVLWWVFVAFFIWAAWKINEDPDELPIGRAFFFISAIPIFLVWLWGI